MNVALVVDDCGQVSCLQGWVDDGERGKEFLPLLISFVYLLLSVTCGGE